MINPFKHTHNLSEVSVYVTDLQNLRKQRDHETNDTHIKELDNIIHHAQLVLEHLLKAVR